MKRLISILTGLAVATSLFTTLPAEELVSEEIAPESSYVYQVPELQEETEDYALDTEELDDGLVSEVEEISDSLPVVSASDPSTFEATKISGVYNSVKGADIRWKKVDGATGYMLYRQRQAEGIKTVAIINDPDTLEYYDSEIRDNCWGRVYVYYVCAFFGSEKGPESNKVTLQRLAPMKIAASSGSPDGRIDLSWACTTSSNKAEGYEIHFATSWPDLSERSGSFQTDTVYGRNSLKESLSGLTIGKTYHIRIRSFVNYTHSVTGKTTKTWSQFSDVVRVKIPTATPTPTPKPTATATPKPTTAPRPTTAPQVSSYQYVLNKNSHVFHYSWCSSVKRMSARNKWFYTGTRNQVIAMGYKACHNCKP